MSKRAFPGQWLLVVCALLGMTPGWAIAQASKVPVSEVLLLPKFCWSQYMSNVKGPQYSISKSRCGVGMNHYCPALIQLNRAMKSTGSKRRQHLVVAKRGIQYTLEWMKPYPSCPIRAQVEASSREVDSMLRFAPPR